MDVHEMLADELRAKRQLEAAQEWRLMDARERTEALSDDHGRDRYMSLPVTVLLGDPGNGSDSVPWIGGDAAEGIARDER